MAADFQIPVDRLLPMLTATLTDESGPLNLSGASGVRFQMRAPGTCELKIDAIADIISAAAGQVRYTWQTGDTDTSGLWIGWFEVATSGKTFAAPEPSLVLEVTQGACAP